MNNYSIINKELVIFNNSSIKSLIKYINLKSDDDKIIIEDIRKRNIIDKE